MQFNFSLVLLLLTGLALSQVLATSKELEASSEEKDVHVEDQDIEGADEDQDRSKKEVPVCIEYEDELETVEHPEEALPVAILTEEPKPEIISLSTFEDPVPNIQIHHVEQAVDPPLQVVNIQPAVQYSEAIKIQPVVQPTIKLQPVIRPLQAINIQPAVQPPKTVNIQPAAHPLQAMHIQPAIRPPQATHIQPAIRPPQATHIQPAIRPPQAVNIQPALPAINPFNYRPIVPSPQAVNLQPAAKPAPSENPEPSAKAVPSGNLTVADPAVSPYNVLPIRAPLANFNPISLPRYPQFDPRIDYDPRRLIGAPNGNLNVESFYLQQAAPLSPLYRSPLRPLRPLPLERFYRPRTPFELIPPYVRPPRRQCFRHWPQPMVQHPYYQRPYAGIPPADLIYDRPIRYLEFREPPALDRSQEEQRD